MEKKIILFGAGEIGEQALNFFGSSNVYCFVDNKKHNRRLCGKSIISFDELLEIHKDYKVIISTVYSIDEIKQQLMRNGIDCYVYIEILAKYRLKAPSIPSIAKLKNIHYGKEIVLIGNGPSLKVEDLEYLHNKKVKSFACNFINKIFRKTVWRPDFYCAIEKSAILTNKEFILNPDFKGIKFINNIDDMQSDMSNYNCFAEDEIPHNINFINMIPAAEKVSQDVSRIIYDGHTVMVPMLQIAIYMGFTEIYLLGVDNTQPPFVHTSNFVESKSHFYEEDENELARRREIIKTNTFVDDWDLYQDKTTRHYKVVNEYAKEQGVKIFNATRGGKLEVFERVDFDNINFRGL